VLQCWVFPRAPDARAARHPHHPHHDGAGVDAEPHGEVDTVLYRQTGIQDGDGLDNAQASVHGAPGIVFMGCG